MRAPNSQQCERELRATTTAGAPKVDVDATADPTPKAPLPLAPYTVLCRYLLIKSLDALAGAFLVGHTLVRTPVRPTPKWRYSGAVAVQAGRRSGVGPAAEKVPAGLNIEQAKPTCRSNFSITRSVIGFSLLLLAAALVARTKVGGKMR